tara:strand:- start:3583 stop:4302 length:720 start_codon:yes stop_codon:yes gene_type:complete
MKIQHYLPSRKWCLAHAPLIHKMSKQPKLRTDNTRLWEYPFVYNLIKEKTHRNADIIDIGAGDAAFGKFIANDDMYTVTAVDNYEAGHWDDMKEAAGCINMRVVHNSCTDLNKFKDEQFDVALLVSVLEHVPTNMIFNNHTGKIKKGDEVFAEYPIRRKVISEALRVTRKGGTVILTTDIYLDWVNEMNISFDTLLGYQGIDRSDIMRLDPNTLHDIYVTDNPIHKGRIMPVCLTIDKE